MRHRRHDTSTHERLCALWGSGGRSLVVVLALLLTLAVPPTAMGKEGGASVPQSLLDAASADPDRTFLVIVQGDKGVPSSTVATTVESETEGSKPKLKNIFRSISGVAAEVDGKTLLKLARHPKVAVITPDEFLRPVAYENAEMWRTTVNVAGLWGTLDLLAPQAPAIAIIDSGIDASKVQDFGSRIVARASLSSLTPGAVGDDEGHGTMVAGLAAGASAAYPGAAKNAPLIDLRTSDAQGKSLTSDVIAACDWILANKQQYNIRVANLSMTGETLTTFRLDPLDKAVERLWLDGVVVVAAAGNYGSGAGAVNMSFAPGNDPFIISVGAADQNQTSVRSDDAIAPWSAYGHTADGFAKPDLSAPGRYLIMPVPAGAYIPSQLPDRVVAPGYMWMSGTSFAAPIVAGAAAQILARHPAWAPDQVKGALMLTADYLPNAGFAAGVGEIDAAAAASVTSPPNANENLNAFVVTDPATGARAFDDAAWAATVSTDANWSSANWSSANWSSANWSSANWSSANWSSANWSSANWSSANWSSANWSSANWSE